MNKMMKGQNLTRGSARAGNSPSSGLVQGARIKPPVSPAERLMLSARNARKQS